MQLVMKLSILEINRTNEFADYVVPLDLDGPVTLTISRGQFGLGTHIQIVDIEGKLRSWHSAKIRELKFEVVTEEENASQSHQEISVLWAKSERPHAMR